MSTTLPADDGLGKTRLARIWSYTVVVVMVVVVGLGVAWWDGWFSIGGFRGPGLSGKGLANAEMCKRDRDCASGYCSRAQKRCEARAPRGNRCTADRECESNDCGLATDRATLRTCK